MISIYKLVISEICCNFKVLIYIELQTKKRYDHRRQSFSLRSRKLLKYFVWQTTSASFLMQ